MATLTPTQIASLQAADHDDKRSVYMAGNAICLAFAVISVVLRFWSRRIARTHIGPDDWLILAATVSSSNRNQWKKLTLSKLITGIYTSLLIAIAHFGMGRHAWWMTDVKTFAQVSCNFKHTRMQSLIGYSCRYLLRQCTTFLFRQQSSQYSFFTNGFSHSHGSTVL